MRMRLICPEGNLGDLHLSEADISVCTLRGEIIGGFCPSPVRVVTDVYHRVMKAFGQHRVMVLYMDGLGYDLYQRSTLPYIKTHFLCEPARTAYPPVTQPCMASMLTGCWPDEHGVFSRKDHRVAAPSLLSLPGAVLVEADEELLALEKPAHLTLPQAGEDVDDAVLRAALPFASGEAPLVMVHFHGLDDLEHVYGDELSQLEKKLSQLDAAVEALCQVFHGQVIFCADHGVHSEDGHGRHGVFDYRDMYIPYGEAMM